MKKRWMQAVVSISLVIAAAATVVLYERVSPAGGLEARDVEAHVHGAAPGNGGAGPVHLDGESARRIGITYAVAESRALERTVRTVAVVELDETRVFNVNSKIDGWIERLHVDFTGAPVRKGDPLLEIYSPALVAAQEELLLARSLALASANGPEGRTAESALRLLESTRRRLEYWDVPADQIARLEETGQPRKTLLMRAPADGIVLEKNAFEGTRIAPGMVVYRIADLSSVWVEGEVFTKDLSLVQVGQRALVRIDGYPGEPFPGTVTYVYPTVSLESRSGRVRVQLPNPQLRLRPGMYAEMEMRIAPERESVVVPRGAVLGTGERSLLFVRRDDGMLDPREVTPGLAAGAEIEILAGLEPGEVVVSSATFLVDAEANLGAAIRAMPGMDMEDELPGVGPPPPGHDH